MTCTVFVCDRCNLRAYGEETFDGRSTIRNATLWCAEPLDVEPRLFGRGAPCPTCGVRQALFADAHPVTLGREEYEVSEATWALVNPTERSPQVNPDDVNPVNPDADALRAAAAKANVHPTDRNPDHD